MNEKVGDRAVCSQCGKTIIFVGPYWDHPGEIKPKHPAFPVDDNVVTEWQARLRTAERNAERWRANALFWYGQRDDLRAAIRRAAAQIPHSPDTAATILSAILDETSGEEPK